ncbi:hypothetical protein FN846DRAFT_811723 [Sphaerosporella brunnea]|uniref:Rhodopsin domain-containing protein n=1 Tax=Sphaerosporella brunnea TaxID=1250544 RepID=A0A5J5EER8_9PEZI|nr:hypothetical protein FN846DRAFT_555908 [Sphaerosporella brunnea]KAA8907991.1 hypothetical protein FN846DRAFT_811723 [Sphaerosporella brunnea]
MIICPNNDFIREAFTLLGIGMFVIGLRTFARWSSVGIRNFAFDDYLMLFAGCVYALDTGVAYMAEARFFGMANNSMNEAFRRKLPPHGLEWTLRVEGSKVQLVGWNLYVLVLWNLKLCMAVFYSRLTDGLFINVRINIAYGAIGVTYVATVLSILFGCYPLHKNWQIYPNPGNHCQPAISKVNVYVTLFLNLITDIYLLSIPLPLLWSLSNLTRRRRLMLIAMFSGGVFVMIAGILRCVLILTDSMDGAREAASWALREIFVAAIIGNVPMIYPLFLRAVNKLQSAWRSVFPSEVAGGSDPHHVEMDEPRPSKPARRKPNLMSITLGGTGGSGGSEERIVPSAEKPSSISVTKEFSQEDSVAADLERGRGSYGGQHPGCRVEIKGGDRTPPAAPGSAW